MKVLESSEERGMRPSEDIERLVRSDGSGLGEYGHRGLQEEGHKKNTTQRYRLEIRIEPIITSGAPKIQTYWAS
jgi:hypothetical protein